jgi:hypothetical protein
LLLSFAQKILILDEFFFKNGISLSDIFLIPKEIKETFGKSKHLFIAEACENFSPL